MGTLSQQITSQVTSLQGLLNHLEGIRAYLERVATKRLPINHTILYLLQDIFNLLPNLNVDEFSKAFVVKTNDQLLVVYLASLIRAVIALHELIQNKVANREAERQEATSSSSSSAKKKDKESKEQVCQWDQPSWNSLCSAASCSATSCSAASSVYNIVISNFHYSGKVFITRRVW